MMSEKKKGLGGLFAKTPTESAPEVNIPTQKDVKKRWMMVGAGAVGLMIIGSTLLQETPQAPKQSNETDPKKLLSLDPGRNEGKSAAQETQKDVESIRRKNEQLERELELLKKRGTSGGMDAPSSSTGNYPTPPATLPTNIVPPPGSPDAQGPKDSPPAPPVPREPVTPVAPVTTVPVPPTVPNSMLPPSIPPMSASMMEEQPAIFAGKPKDGGLDAAAPGPRQRTSANTGGARTSKPVKNKYSGYIPSGAFVPVALLTGVDAAASPVAQSNPQPILVQVQADATLPNLAKYKLNKCFALLSAYGDLSSERVYGRVTRISCTDKENKLVLDQAAQGHLVDSDGSLGLRGIIEDRQGAKLGKALLAGFASGLAGAFTSGVSGTTSLVTGLQSGITADQALTKGAYSGAQTAANQIAQFYLQQAQQIFPVIVVPNGRTGSIFLSQGIQLEFKNGSDAFTTEMKPE